MAISALQIINRALRIIRAIDANEAASASDAQDGLDTLNALLAEWHEARIGLPDYSFKGLTDTLSTDAADRDAIAYQLAIRMAPEYGLSLSPEAQLIANETMGRLRLRYFQPGTTDFSELPHVMRVFNIVTGDY